MAAAPTRDFFELVKAIGESKSKQEEDRIIAEEVVYLKKAIPQTGVPKKKMKEMLLRAIYVEMLGQDASFAYIKSVELCASTSISQKRVGYLTAALFLSPQHEFRVMLVNQIQRDMKSSNMLEITAALIAVCKLVTEDMIPAVIGDVLNLLNHDMEHVRKKAIAAIHRFYQLDKQTVLDHVDKLRRALCDRDPSVMGATLPLFHAMIVDDVMQFKDLVPSFVSILKQIIEHRLPRDFDYHRIPAPWIQMNIIRILAVLGRGDQAASEGMYEILAEVMKRADTGINVGYAVVYECVSAVITIYPNSTLMDAAATAISRFIRSDSHNLKYIGIKGLAGIVKDHPKYAADHQLAVIDCLEDPDETLKRKTLDLLYRMTNAVNVEFIVNKLLSFLATSVDDHFRSDLVNQISQCAERFAPSNAWYVHTIIRVFELAGDKVKSSVAQTLMQLIAEGADAEEDDEELNSEKDDELRKEAVDAFLILLDTPHLPSILLQTLAWVLGEYGYLSTTTSKETIMDQLCNIMHTTTDSSTTATLATALGKIIAQHGSCPAKVLQTITKFSQSRSLDLQQRCLEILALLRNPSIMVEILPVDASCEDIDVDEHLSFLNSFVQQALNYGAKPYAVPLSMLEDMADEDPDRKKQLKITPYATPSMPVMPVSASLSAVAPAPVTSPAASAASAAPSTIPSIVSNSTQPLSIATAQGNQLLGVRGAAPVWGKKPEPPPPAPEPAAPSSSSSVPSHDAAAAHPAEAHTNGSHAHGGAAALPNAGGMWGPGQSASPAPAPVPVASAPAAPPAPRVLTEKEKMAAALFGGVGASKPAAASAASKRKSVAESTSVSAPSTPQPVVSPAPVSTASNASPATAATTASSQPVADLMDSMDLLGLVSPAAAAPAPVAASAPSSSGAGALSLDDFELGLMGGNATSVTTSAGISTPVVAPASQAPSSAHQASANLMDLLAPMPAPSPAAVAHAMPPQRTTSPVPTMSNAALISDVFGNLDLTQSGTMSMLSQRSDFNMAPLAITTAEFGKRWGVTRQDTKQSVSCGWPRLDLDSLRKAIPAGYHHVESIPTTQEAIFAATVTNLGAVVLLHCKVNAPKRAVDIIVKCTAPDVTQKEAQRIFSAFASFRG